MKQTSFFRFFFLLFFFSVANSLCCGTVYDGPTYGEDIDVTNSHHRVFASWKGFKGNCNLSTTTGSRTSKPVSLSPRPSTTRTRSHTESLAGVSGRAHSSTRAFNGDKHSTSNVTYQVAVISETLANSIIFASGNDAESFYPRCRFSTGIGRIKPDIVDWTFVYNNETYINMNVTLQSGIRYFTLIRAHIQGSKGQPIYSNTNGFTPNPHTGADDDDGADDELPQGNGHYNDDDDGDNDDAGNLNDDGNDEDDDSDLAPYQAGLIAMGVAIFVLCIIFAIICLLGLVSRRKGDKYDTNVVRNENVEKI